MLVLFSFFFLININAFIFSNSIIMLLFCLQIKKKKQWPEIKLRSFSEAINLFVRLEFCWALWATLIMRDCALSTQHNYKSGPQSNDLESLPGAVGIPPVWVKEIWTISLTGFLPGSLLRSPFLVLTDLEGRFQILVPHITHQGGKLLLPPLRKSDLPS